ncbi:hypothetical protein [Solicola gregarius]|uniref:Lipoprotein n=1 Tax=Solicola gregarius TaxID=2908642 RepID=A0AA46TJW4_9ACTN|nr:hypothetical protein [Solicola gregarius]UYM06212.1 hypothetical protein L0C25_03805 [Solicola gregarius]
MATALLASCSSDDDTGAEHTPAPSASRTLTPETERSPQKAAPQAEAGGETDHGNGTAEPQPDEQTTEPEESSEAPTERSTTDPSRTRTAPNLPEDGEGVLDGRRMVALYGVPGTSSLGALGEQPLGQAIERVKGLAKRYEPLTDDDVVPTFELIASVASTSAGADGDFSSEISPSTLRPWIERAAKEGVYVVLDLQPGRTDFLTQAKRFEALLRYPNVGLALDPEWRLGPRERHLEQIGSVHGKEVDATIGWLAELTRREELPEKLVVLHQFRTSMIADRRSVRTDRDAVTVLIHADGQGTQPAKRGTWKALHEGAPKGVRWGWKNFIDEDHPMLTPQQTYRITPRPDFVSYQ